MRDSDIAYEKIKTKIITAQLMPGAVVIESELMKEFNMGRTPIREALNRLSWENQVRIIPRQCIMVSEQPRRDLESIFQVRYTLSKLEGELAATRRTEEDIQNLREILQEFEVESDAGKRVMLDRKFHQEISRITRNSFLENEMNQMLDLSIRLLFLNKEQLDSLDSNSVEEHHAIIDSIEKKDTDQTIHLLQEHVMSFRKKFIYEI